MSLGLAWSDFCFNRTALVIVWEKMQGQGKEQERLRRCPHHPRKRRRKPAQEEVREVGA